MCPSICSWTKAKKSNVPPWAVWNYENASSSSSSSSSSACILFTLMIFLKLHHILLILTFSLSLSISFSLSLSLSLSLSFTKSLKSWPFWGELHNRIWKGAPFQIRKVLLLLLRLSLSFNYQYVCTALEIPDLPCHLFPCHRRLRSHNVTGIWNCCLDTTETTLNEISCCILGTEHNQRMSPL